MKPWILLASLGLLLNACGNKSQKSNTSKNLFLTTLQKPDTDFYGLTNNFMQPITALSIRTGQTGSCRLSTIGNPGSFYGPSSCSGQPSVDEWETAATTTTIITPEQARISSQPLQIYMTETPNESKIYNKGNAPAAGAVTSGNGKIIR